jgi:DNA/RNA-binding domain of Phe-tRNA-synthetase-like protein
MQTAIKVDPELFSLVPGYRRTVVLARRDSAGDPAAVGAALSAAAERCRARIAEVTSVAELAPIARWRRAFSAVGFDPTRTRPAVEALARRASRGESVALGNPLIDAGTAVSLEFLVAVGVHVLDELEGDLELGRATGDEEFVTFQGQHEPPEPGELVYRCGSIVLTRRWVWKQGRVGSVGPSSRALAVNVDVLDDQDGARAATARLTDLLEAGGAEVTGMLTLSPDTPVGLL